jgi:hypothetical protein
VQQAVNGDAKDRNDTAKLRQAMPSCQFELANTSSFASSCFSMVE